MALTAPSRLPPNRGSSGFTLVELAVAMVILSLVLAGLGLYIRHSQTAVTRMSSRIVANMELRQAFDILTSTLGEGTEIVKPLAGSTLPFLVMKDTVNRLVILYLEKESRQTAGPNRLVCFLDDFSSSPPASRRTVLLERVRTIAFTALSAGCVLARLSLIDSEGHELSGMVEVTLANFGMVDP